MMDKWMYFCGWRWWLNRKYNTVWDKVGAYIKKEFDNKPVYKKEYLKTKVKFYGNEATDFYDEKTAKADSNHIYLAVSSLDFVLVKDESHYLQIF